MMTAYIILSVGNGLLESKPFMCGSNEPPTWEVPIADNIDLANLPRFVESANFMDMAPRSMRVMRFVRTEHYRFVQTGLMARIYEYQPPYDGR